jgi:hypothetical protein
MRYYDLVISDPKSGKVWKPKPKGDGFLLSAGGSTFTSYINGKTDPGALNIEFDIPVAPFNTPQGSAIIRVWGISLQMIGQSSDLAGQNIRLSAGMKKGLPLANPKQAGTIMQGTIFQGFGNWQGQNQTLDLICNPPAAGPDQDISFYWPKGMTLATALATVFAQAFSVYSMTSKISIGQITLDHDGSHHASSLAELADYVQQISYKVGSQIYGDSYSGVQITIIGNTIQAYDSSVTQEATELVFRDFMGQPTWINPGQVNFRMVMRSDLAINSKIKFPQRGIVSPYALTTPAAAVPNAPARSKTIFQNDFLINEVHHFGNFRQPDGDSWVTSFTAVVAS